ncbi:hypothetical protein NE237_020169 [Protea cynaroides]|uniref:Uncharacterized protein n=1 Tax=Protea cynaroides TaxID=273540 RepID=A0A9Q0K1E2_9MAGN|nr:hypothetical protein NE237_020169 [Protea cynaroides]
MGNLVILNMPFSQLKKVWKGTKFLPKLKVLDLGYSQYLTCTRDFSGVPNLETLNLEYCPRLVEVHESIDRLSKLVEWNLLFCRSLKNLTSSINKLALLETLNIHSCLKLEKLPKGIGNLTRLTRLIASSTAIEELPSALGLLKNLTKFSYDISIHSHSSSLGVSFSENVKKAATCFASPTQSQSSLGASLYGLRSLKDLNLTYRS